MLSRDAGGHHPIVIPIGSKLLRKAEMRALGAEQDFGRRDTPGRQDDDFGGGASGSRVHGTVLTDRMMRKVNAIMIDEFFDAVHGRLRKQRNAIAFGHGQEGAIHAIHGTLIATSKALATIRAGAIQPTLGIENRQLT